MKILGIIVGVAGMVVLLVLLSSVLVWQVWNWVVPSIFGLTVISWTQALGLTILCNLLFKSTTNTSSKS